MGRIYREEKEFEMIENIKRIYEHSVCDRCGTNYECNIEEYEISEMVSVFVDSSTHFSFTNYYYLCSEDCKNKKLADIIARKEKRNLI